jgi:2,4-dienoyl-CoA reductase (NADPH2)
MSRPFLADAELIARGRSGRPVNPCIACNQACIDRSIGDGRVSCSVNPRAGFELEFPRSPSPGDVSELSRQMRRQSSDTSRGRFAVIGGGPAGMEAARALAALGGEVELFEAEPELGGQFRFARLVPGKEVFGETIAYFEAELAALGVRVHLGRRLGEEDAELLGGFDGVVLASGVVPRRAEIPGAELPHVLTYPEAFEAGVGDAERVAIVGAGGIGVDLAHRLSQVETDEPAAARFLREQDLSPPSAVWPPLVADRQINGDHPGVGPGSAAPRVTLMRRRGRIGAGIGRTTKWVWLEALARAGVETRTGLAYERITAEGIVVRPEGGEPELVAADRVVIAAGQERNDALRPLLEATGVPLRVVGGAENPTELNAVAAFAAGLRAAHGLAAPSTR